MAIDINVLKEQNDLQTEGDKILVKPYSKYEYETFPLIDKTGVLRLTAEEYLGLRANYYCFNDSLTGLEISPVEETP